MDDSELWAGFPEGGNNAFQVDSGGPLICNLLKTKLQLPIPFWSPMVMPRPPGMTSPPILVNSSEFTSPHLASFVVVTLSLTCLRSLVSPNSKKLRGPITSSTNCFNLLLLTWKPSVSWLMTSTTTPLSLKAKPLSNPLMTMKNWSSLILPLTSLDSPMKGNGIITSSQLVSCHLERSNSSSFEYNNEQF